MSQLIDEVKKGVDFYLEGTYDVSALYSHLMAFVRDNCQEAFKEAAEHKNQLERLIFKVEEMRETQRMVLAGHRNKIGEKIRQEEAMDKKTLYLKASKGYSTDRFKIEKPKELF